MTSVTAQGRPRAAEMIRQSFAAMTPAERRRVALMYISILALHVAGFGIFLVFVIPAHYRGLGIGVSVLAYTLGLRHAFDADHIAVIDNSTRKEMNDRQGTGKPRPFCFGYFFSLGHSSVVVAMGVGIVIAEKVVFGEICTPTPGSSSSAPSLARWSRLASFSLSAGSTWSSWPASSGSSGPCAGVRTTRRSSSGSWTTGGSSTGSSAAGCGAISKEWQLYPVGFLFGLGFDTTTEVLLLGTTAFLALQHIPWYAICCLPVLFTAGMALMDTTDGIFMNLAYGWAFFNPVRKVYYNLAITGLSVGICFLVGGIETLGLISTEVTGLRQAGGFWGFMRDFNINVAGFAIVGLFIVTWAAAVLIWRYGQIEEKWSARLQAGPRRSGPGAQCERAASQQVRWSNSALMSRAPLVRHGRRPPPVRPAAPRR